MSAKGNDTKRVTQSRVGRRRPPRRDGSGAGSRGRAAPGAAAPPCRRVRRRLPEGGRSLAGVGRGPTTHRTRRWRQRRADGGRHRTGARRPPPVGLWCGSHRGDGRRARGAVEPTAGTPALAAQRWGAAVSVPLSRRAITHHSSAASPRPSRRTASSWGLSSVVRGRPRPRHRDGPSGDGGQPVLPARGGGASSAHSTYHGVPEPVPYHQ